MQSFPREILHNSTTVFRAGPGPADTPEVSASEGELLQQELHLLGKHHFWKGNNRLIEILLPKILLGAFYLGGSALEIPNRQPRTFQRWGFEFFRCKARSLNRDI